jgi:valyl-tRNA synthetase
MPFITEELWHELIHRKKEDCLIVAEWPNAKSFDPETIKLREIDFEVVTQIRNVRNTKGISPKEPITLFSTTSTTTTSYPHIVKKLANVNEVGVSDSKTKAAASFMVGTKEYYVPLEGKVDAAKEKEDILRELDYNKGFLASVMKKLSNEKFVNGAPPQVIELERKKKEDAEIKIKSLEKRLEGLL